MTFWMVFAIAGFGLLMFLSGIITMYLVHKAVPHKVVQMRAREPRKSVTHSPEVPEISDAGEMIPRSYSGDGLSKDPAAAQDAMENVEQTFDTLTRKSARDITKF